MSINATLKRTIDELDLDRRLTEAGGELDKAVAKVLEVAGGYVQPRQGHIAELVEKAASTIDERTEGKFTGQLSTVKGQVQIGVAKLAERGPSDHS